MPVDLNLGSAVKAMYRAHTERTHRVLCPWWLTSEEAHSTRQSSSHSFSLFSSKSCGAMHLWGCWSYKCLVPEWADCLCVLNYRHHWESGSVSLRERNPQPQKEGFFWKDYSFQASDSGVSGCQLSWCVSLLHRRKPRDFFISFSGFWNMSFSLLF